MGSVCGKGRCRAGLSPIVCPDRTPIDLLLCLTKVPHCLTFKVNDKHTTHVKIAI